MIANDHTTELDICCAIAAAVQKIRTSGRSVYQTANFEEIVDELTASSKGRINKESSPYFNDLTSLNASYVVIRNEARELEGFCAVRRLEIGDEGLVGHWRRQFRRIYGDGADAFHAGDTPPGAHEVKGNVGFISDIFIERTARGPSRLDPTTIVVLALGVIASKWAPDWIYGFTKDRDVRRGLAGRYLATGLYPSAVRWKVETPNRRDDDWLVCYEKKDYRYVLRRFFEDEQAKAEERRLAALAAARPDSFAAPTLTAA